VVALYDAVMSYEKSLERDVLAAFTYAKVEAKMQRNAFYKI